MAVNSSSAPEIASLAQPIRVSDLPGRISAHDHCSLNSLILTGRLSFQLVVAATLIFSDSKASMGSRRGLSPFHHAKKELFEFGPECRAKTIHEKMEMIHLVAGFPNIVEAASLVRPERLSCRSCQKLRSRCLSHKPLAANSR